jgi:hypothetical protein
MEIQQSDLYAEYIRRLKWNADAVDGVWIYSKKIPFFGGLAKIQRPIKFPDFDKLLKFLNLNKLNIVALEPDSSIPNKDLELYISRLKQQHFKINTSPFLCTKTVIVDLTPSESEIFSSFSEAKRRAVRRAIKHNVTIEKSENIKDLINIKAKSAGLFGFITTGGLDKMWEVFGPKNSAIFLARKNCPKRDIIGGVFLIWFDKTAYYWIAGATGEGKKLFAPTLLVWESIKYAKKKGNKLYDFIGVWDERVPKLNTSFKGFTRFKTGFSQNYVYYPLNIT